MTRAQRTLKGAIECSGIGLHSGEECHLRLKPAEADAGIVFVRTDIASTPEVPVSLDYVTIRQRQTTLKNGEAEVQTIEHLLSVLHALRVDNAIIELDAPELPGMDGSAMPFVQMIREVGILEQKAVRKSFTIDEPIYFMEDGTSLAALPAAEGNGLTVSYTLDYGEAGLSQFFTFQVEEASYVDLIAPARTFCLEREVEQLRAMGLGKGATYENTVVLSENGVKNTDLRFSNEPVRHKILDLVGDLALAGIDLDAHVIATKTGHRANIQFVRKIMQEIHARENRGQIQRDTGLDIREIFRLLPHRYPFLMIDRVIELEGFRRAVGIKNVSINEPYFQGHWPEQPIMPGVLQLEAMAQLAGVLLLRKLENTGKLAVLWSIDKVKLRRAVVPGDQLRIECEAVKVRSKMGVVNARGKVNNEIVAEAEFKFTLMDA
ncbi:MAG: UDP-3-O-acyl-N-acetylglucosamine deacetylase [Planctomycetota bacterium]